MKLVCSVLIGNRSLPALAIKSKQRAIKSTIALCKHPNSEDYYLILFNSLNKTGTRYNVKGNISQILTRFICDGKTTIQFKEPPHDWYVQGDVIQLKSFLQLLKKILENKITKESFRQLSSLSVTAVAAKDMPATKLTIKKRSEYPMKGFPRTLEELRINSIRRCSLDLGILQLSKLNLLDLSVNLIEKLPKELSNLHLRELNLSSNCLEKSRPGEWKWLSGNLAKSLLSLNLSLNNLTYLPPDIIKLQALTTLNVTSNRLTNLPVGIGRLRKLRFLNLENNKITVFPGSIRQCSFQQLNLCNNSMSASRDFRFSSAPVEKLPVGSLKEYSGRAVLNFRIPYLPGDIPLTLADYLDFAKYCVCGQACFDVSLRAFEELPIYKITTSFCTSLIDHSFLSVDSYFCSVKCYRNYYISRNRNPLI